MNNKNMAVIAYANGWTMWEYTDTGKTIQEIMAPHFFDKIYHLCAVGDKIYLVCQDGCADATIVRIEHKHVDIKTYNIIKYED